METATITIQDWVDELLVVLDEDIQHINNTLSRLNELRSLVIKRDEVALSKLLEVIKAESDRYKSHESKRQAIRRELAIALGINFEQMTLSVLEAILTKEKKDQLAGRKEMLKSLIKQLNKEHLSTTLLLSECARVNSLLLKSIFDLGKTDFVYYNSNGSAKRQTETAFVNLKF